MNCRGNFHAGFALLFIAATASCRVSLTREYSSHKNSLSSSSCPAGPIARREICMCHSFVSVWQGTWSYVGWIRTRKARRVGGRTFRNQSIGDVPQDFLFRRLHTRRSVKNFSLSLFLSIRSRKFSRRVYSSRIFIIFSPFDRVANDGARPYMRKRKNHRVELIFFSSCYNH